MTSSESIDRVHLTRMGRVYDFIQDHLTEDLSVPRLAEVAILSVWHFQRVFQAYSGESAGAFVRRLRVERAANLLMIHKSLTIEAIAAECGFGSAELLARHFRGRFQIRPTQWRSSSPEVRYRTSRQAWGRIQGQEGIPVGDQKGTNEQPWNQPVRGTISGLTLERRPRRQVIYTRHFQGYDHGVASAYQRLEHWARPRGLVDGETQAIGIGLDNPWITEPQRCRYLACFTVKTLPEGGEGIGTKTIPEGLFAVIDYRGSLAELPRAYHELYRVLLPRAGLEALADVDYQEHRSIHSEPEFGEEYRCRLALPVRSL